MILMHWYLSSFLLRFDMSTAAVAPDTAAFGLKLGNNYIALSSISINNEHHE